MNILLIIVLLVIVFCAINGMRKGLLGIVYGLVSWLFIFIFVIWSNPYIEEYLINRTGLYDRVMVSTENYFLDKEEKLQENTAQESDKTTKEDNKTDDNVLKSLTESKNVLSDLGLVLPKTIEKSCTEAIDKAEEAIITSASKTIADFIMKGIAVLIAFIIAIIITNVVGYMVKLVGELPVISGINGLFGVVAGAFQGLLYVWIFMYVVAWMATSDTGQILINYINENTFLTYLYQHNLVITILENF